MEIKHRNTTNKGAFFIEVEGTQEAELTYTMAGNTRMIIDHTEVSEKLKGKGAGKQLVSAAVDFARTHQLKVIPLCPFAHAVFEKTPEWQDVLDER